MPTKKNPLDLNALQLKTLTLLQVLAQVEGFSMPAPDNSGVLVMQFPHPHGNHFHLGDYVVMTADATGLFNAAVWTALDRKGLVRSQFPDGGVITPEGLSYDTGIKEEILHRADH